MKNYFLSHSPKKIPTKQYLALDQDMGLKLVEFPWATGRLTYFSECRRWQ